MAVHREKEEEEEDKRRLILSTVKVVEYLEPLMSVELLCKFPDNSAYDFDYSQSTIWSPLVSPPYSPMDLDSWTPRNLFGAHSSAKKVGSRLRKKFATYGFNLNLDLFKSNKMVMMMMKKKKKKMASDLSPTPMRIKSTCNPIVTKGWDKVLKAASKQFKRRKMKKDPTAHMMLPK